MIIRRGRPARAPWRAVVASAIAAAAVTASTGCGVGLQDLPIGRTAEGPAYRVTAVFDHADRILEGTEVRVGQQVVGRVHDLATDGRYARVGLSLSDDVPLPSGATATIELPSALGDPFIRLETEGAGSASPGRSLAEGDVIPISRTRVGPELETSLASLGLLLNGSGVDQLHTVVTELDAAYGGRGDEVGDLTRRLNDLLGAVSDRSGDLDRTLAAVDETTGRLVAHQDDLVRGLEAAAPTSSLVAGQRDRIAALVTTTSSLAAHADTLLDRTSGAVGSEVDQLSAILSALQGLDDTDTALLENAGRFLTNFSSAIRGDYLTFDGALDVPQSIENLWSGGRLPDGGGVTGPGR